MRLFSLLGPDDLSARCPHGFSGEVGRWAAAGRKLRELGAGEDTETRALFVPGRLEIVGKHTDYAGGSSLVAAVDRGFFLAMTQRDDREIRLHDLASGEVARLDLAGDLTAPAGHWTRYPCSVARRLRRDFSLSPRGAEVVFSSTLPIAAGMSSSSALVVASWWALGGHRLAADVGVAARLWLAEYLAAIEAGRATPRPIPEPFAADARHGREEGQGQPPGTPAREGRRNLPAGTPATGAGATQDGIVGVGTRGGSEDHTAILCSQAGRLGRYAYAPTRLEDEVELPPGLVFAVAVSGVRAEKTGGARDAYNRASDLATRLAGRWRAATDGNAPHLAAILASGPAAADTLARLAAEDVSGATTRRLEHYRAESEEIVPAATAALAGGDLGAFGRLVDRSQRLAESLLGNQVGETVHLAAAAREIGAPAASAFGAGFGGAVWALIDGRRAEGFVEEWRAAYLDVFPQRGAEARFFLTRPGPGAFEPTGA